MILTSILAGAVMAISVSAPPGPVAAETIRRGLRGGFRTALRVQLGSVIGDAVWLAIALLGLAPLVQLPVLRAILAVAGVGVLLLFGLNGLRDAWKFHGLQPGEEPRTARSDFWSGMAISTANPMALAFWLSVGGSLIAAGVVGTTPAQTVWFVAGFVAGVLIWSFVMASMVGWSKRMLQP